MQATTQMSAQRPVRRAAAGPSSFSPSTAAWFRLAAVYLVVAIALGIAMGASGNFALRPVHAHVSLLGWTGLALAGLIYRAFPAAGASRLAAVHFWLFNLALPPMMGALAALLLGRPQALPVLVASQFVVAAGLLAFVANVFLNVGSAPRELAHAAGAAAIEVEAR